ncbi:high affinity choline transporter 1-like [Mizuhopecten yessoensis]|uniref:High affinity choline transporter 1 n=1 Tax=Mizuhopecten yessoensis TaxID=6573 RepID=A0A210Q5H8_MIZYE|nr:high affinity choline transporter 1-like [Mizuhopecten yessoensis]OWF43994.1 High affinity choline transporter 1 [Mizuhopecten yessoensis]
MSLNVPGLVVLLIFYVIIFLVGIYAAKRKKWRNGGPDTLETSIVAGRRIGAVVGVFTMTATTVGGGYINGTAESIATGGLVWTLAPFGIFIGLSIGGMTFAKRMRDQNYLTMLDPFQEVYGSQVVFLVYIASIWGDLFWTASILSALGTSLSVILDWSRTVAIVSSSAITVGYTMIGQMISVAYTDVVQLLLITGGLVLCVPFVLTNENVGNIVDTTSDWIGQYDTNITSLWIDLFIAMTFGTIPWQAYFQRVLSVQGGKEAQILSVVGGASALVLFIPSLLIGAAAVSADWTNTTLGMSPMAANKADMVLPYVLNEFTPVPVAVIGLGAISAAVMSSMDSSVLASSSMFTKNIYKQLLRPKASDTELIWIQRLAILTIGSTSAVVSLVVPGVYGLFILAADVVFVIILPQLICAVFLKWTNVYGSVTGYVIGTLLRIGAGEPSINLQPFIFYPAYEASAGQNFPFRTFAMVSSLSIIVFISILTNELGLPMAKSGNAYTLHSRDISSEYAPESHTNSFCTKLDQQNRHTGFTNCDHTIQTNVDCSNYKEDDFTNCTIENHEDAVSDSTEIKDDEFTNFKQNRKIICGINSCVVNKDQQRQELIHLKTSHISNEMQ